MLLQILSLENVTIRVVKARIAEEPKGLSDAGEILIKNEDGEWLKQPPWAIKVVEELDPDVKCGSPFSRLLSGRPMSSLRGGAGTCRLARVGGSL